MASKEMSVRRTLWGVNLFALGLSLIYFFGALGYPLGTFARPGPGLYPLFVGLLLLVASVGSLVSNWISPSGSELQFPKGKDLRRVLVVIAGTITYALLLSYLGHLLASLVSIYIVLCSLGQTSWHMKIAFTIAMALSSFYLFDVLLKVPLPRGSLW